MATPNTERVKCERSTAKDGQLAVTMWKGNPTTFQLGLFESGSAINISGLSSVTWRVKNARTGITVLMAKTVSDLTACSGSQWQTGAGQHASISFNADECNLAVTSKSAAFHLTITGLLSGGEEVTFGMGTLTVINANAAPAGDPPTNPDPAMSSGQADGRYVRFDGEQGLTPEQQEQARVNIGVTSGGDEYSADVGTFLAASDKAGMRSAMDLGDAAVKNIGTTAGTVAAGDHGHTALTVQAAATPSVRALGNTSTTACAGNDSRLSDARTPMTHTHELDDVILLPESLQALSDEIDGKANAIHSHAIGDVTGLQTALDGKAASSHAHSDASTGAAGFMTVAMVTKLAAQQAAASVASGATTAIGGLAEVVTITGTTGIASFGASTEGERHLLIFAGAVTLTHGAALSIPGSANFTTQANDRLWVRGTAAGWAVDPMYVRGGLAAMIGAVSASGVVTAGSHVISSNGDVLASINGALGFSGRAQVKSTSTASMDLLASDGSTMATLRALAVAARPASGTNAAGQDLTLSAGAGTGTGTPGRLVLRASPPGSSGSTAQTLRDHMIIASTGLTGRAGESTDFYRLAGNRYTSDTVSMQDQLDTDQILHQCSLAAGMLSRNGDRLEITAEMTCSLGSDNGTWRLYLNATLVAAYESNVNLPGRIRASVRRVNGAQVKVSLEEIPPPGGLPYASPLVPAWVSVDFEATLTVTVSGQSGGSSNVTSELLCVDFFPAR